MAGLQRVLQGFEAEELVGGYSSALMAYEVITTDPRRRDVLMEQFPGFTLVFETIAGKADALHKAPPRIREAYVRTAPEIGLIAVFQTIDTGLGARATKTRNRASKRQEALGDINEKAFLAGQRSLRAKLSDDIEGTIAVSRFKRRYSGLNELVEFVQVSELAEGADLGSAEKKSRRVRSGLMLLGEIADLET